MKVQKTPTVLRRSVESLILNIRGERVILDADLAAIYGVETRVLNQAVKRNGEKFPGDFMFRLSPREAEEVRRLRSQIVILKTGRGGHRKYLPYAFTEHGAIMVANVLNSTRAAQMSIFVVRAFIRMRGMLADNKELGRKLSELERALKKRLDFHERAIIGILQRIMDLIEPPIIPEPKKRPIGFDTE